MRARVTIRAWPRSLAVRVTLLCGLVAVAMMGMLGMYFFVSARIAINAHADEQLMARAEHLRRLVGEVRTVVELRERAMLFGELLGGVGDVLILRGAGGSPLVEINPDHVPLPDELRVAAADHPLGPGDLRETRLRSGLSMRWVAGVARSGRDGAMIEVAAGHPLEAEMRMVDRFRTRVLRSTFAAMVVCTLLVYLVLRHGLRPLRRVADQAALIDPINLAIRLPEQDAPLELRHMVAVFNAMLDRIAVGYARLSQFSADLAHEIRTPVGALIGQTQVTLHRTRDAAEYRQVLESNLEELNRIRLIVDNILFLAQADHATLEIERRPFVLADELTRIAEYFEGPADEAGLGLAVEASGTAQVDAALCGRAVHNLVVNALRYAASGTTVRLIGRQDEHGATITVENQGTPLPAAQQARLFDRFYRADTGQARPAGASGLGLAIVKAIMELHGGEAGVTSTPAGTIRFELRFPTRQP